MGKRKLNGTSFWQCDWTGLPMKQAHCYLPSWAPSGKLVRKGSYCNWESVVAHAYYLHFKGDMKEADLNASLGHIESVTGVVPRPAPSYEELAHTKGTLSPSEFHAKCIQQLDPVLAVKITPEGVEEVELLADGLSVTTGRFLFDRYLTKPPLGYHAPPSSFHSVRKKGRADRELVIFYYPCKNLPYNSTASNLFKMQLYGDVILVQQSREGSFLPRERYVDFSLANYQEAFEKKRKKADAPALSVEGYSEVKEEMQQALDKVEESVTASAVPPKTMSKAQSPGPTSGCSLAAKVKGRSGEAVPMPPQSLLPVA